MKILYGIIFVLVCIAVGLYNSDNQISKDFRWLRGEGNTETSLVMPPISAAQNESNQNVVNINETKDFVSTYKDRYSIYIESNDLGIIEVSPHRLRAASMIKVFILAYLFDQVDKNLISLDERITLLGKDKVGGSGSLQSYDEGISLSIDFLAEKMITESDNTATNILIDRLGIESINQYIARNGYGDTYLQRKMMDSNAISKGLENYTSASDLGLFFHRLYKNEIVSSTWDTYMKDILIRQTDTECIASALPDYTVAHKTGELVGVYHDGGIIYTPKGDYILVLLSDLSVDRFTVIEEFKEITKYINYKIGNNEI